MKPLYIFILRKKKCVLEDCFCEVEYQKNTGDMRSGGSHFSTISNAVDFMRIVARELQEYDAELLRKPDPITKKNTVFQSDWNDITWEMIFS